MVHSLFQPSNTLTFVVNSSVGIPQANVVLNLNGANVSGLTFSGSSTLWNVSYPVKTNGFYTAIITLTDTAGTTSFTNSFTTFDAGDYQWEAEDYDYCNGQYFDNPQVDAYAGLAGVSGWIILNRIPMARAVPAATPIVRPTAPIFRTARPATRQRASSLPYRERITVLALSASVHGPIIPAIIRMEPTMWWGASPKARELQEPTWRC